MPDPETFTITIRDCAVSIPNYHESGWNAREVGPGRRAGNREKPRQGDELAAALVAQEYFY